MKNVLLSIIACSMAVTSCSTIRKQSYEPIVITSNPTGANITIDGYDCGQTPQPVEISTNYSHQIVVEKQNYEMQSYLLKPQKSGRKLCYNAVFPVAVGGLSAAAMAIALASTGGATYGLAPLVVAGAAVIGLAAGGALGVVGVGVDLFSKKAQTFPTSNLHFNLEQ